MSVTVVQLSLSRNSMFSHNPPIPKRPPCPVHHHILLILLFKLLWKLANFLYVFHQKSPNYKSGHTGLITKLSFIPCISRGLSRFSREICIYVYYVYILILRNCLTQLWGLANLKFTGPASWRVGGSSSVGLQS